MDDIRKKLEKSGIAIPDILLPQKMNLGQWAVIACDQFTQDLSYWAKAEKAAAGSASALNLIYPEVFLDTSNCAAQEACGKRIEKIHRSMQSYLDTGIFAEPRHGFMYIERDTPYKRGRKGLVAAIDLEQYSWLPEERRLIRPTEGTVSERLPPRMDIRRNAAIEIPHIILLIDDDTDSLLPELGERAKKNEYAYSGALMLNSGSISGWFLDRQEDWAFLADKLEELACRALSRYITKTPDEQPFLFAVGDGNHSLASAMEIWKEYKNAADPQKDESQNCMHPYRYAMVEIENIYDPAIHFEPIHRVVFGMDFNLVLKLLSALPGFSSRIITSREELVRLIAEPVKGNRFGIISKNRYALVETNTGGISTVCLQPLLDAELKQRVLAGDTPLSIDYIHGEDELFRITGTGSSVPGCATGILLPPVQKAGFFETIARCGPLPRKSFSMGEAEEKRFYIECRKLCKH